MEMRFYRNKNTPLKICHIKLCRKCIITYLNGKRNKKANLKKFLKKFLTTGKNGCIMHIVKGNGVFEF